MTHSEPGGGEQKTNYDVSTLVGEGGTSAAVSEFTSSPIVTAMVVSIVLNIALFSILYYQVELYNSYKGPQYVLLYNFFCKKN